MFCKLARDNPCHQVPRLPRKVCGDKPQPSRNPAATQRVTSTNPMLSDMYVSDMCVSDLSVSDLCVCVNHLNRCKTSTCR